MQKFLGLAELNLIGTVTYRFKDKFAHRYCFQSARVIDRNGEKLLETDRFYVWGEAIDTVYKIAVDHMFAPINSVPHDCVDYGEGGGLYDAEIDEQHEEVWKFLHALQLLQSSNLSKPSILRRLKKL